MKFELTVMNYEELKKRIILNFFERIILKFSQKARYNSSIVVSTFDNLIIENREIKKIIKKFNDGIQQMLDYTLDREIEGDENDSNISLKKYKYSLKEYKSRIDFYMQLNKNTFELLEYTEGNYCKINAYRLLISVYYAVNNGKDGIIIFSPDFEIDSKKLEDYKCFSKKSKEDVIFLSDIGVDEFGVSFFGENYKGIIIKTSCSFERAFKVISDYFAKNTIFETRIINF